MVVLRRYAMSADRDPAAVQLLPATVDAPRLARDFAAHALGRRGAPGGRADDLALVVSELVTNAVVHGPDAGEIELRLSATPLTIRVEVSDAGTVAFDWPKAAEPPGSHGLDLVGMFSERCGVDRVPWTVAWCELDLV